MIERHKTAISRTDLSRPIQLALNAGLLTEDQTFLDYGCGRGDDLRALDALGFDCRGWDPVHRPDGELRESDVVNLGYVVNVIEDPRERVETLKSAWAKATKALVVAARVDIQALPEEVEEHADGVITTRGTFQKFYAQPELRGWIDEVLETQSVAAGPGIFFVFRSDMDRQRYASALVRRRLQSPVGRVSEALFEQHRAALEPLVEFFHERGRLPNEDELSTATQLVAGFGSIPKAFRAVRTALADAKWNEIEEARRDDLLVYLGLERFGKRAAYGELQPELQHDIKAFFGTYTKGCSDADTLLFSTGDLALVGEACRQAEIGKLTPDGIYVHHSALDQLPPRLRMYEGCARVMVGEVEGASLIKLDRTRPKVSYLSYPDFDTVAHPTLESSVVVWLDTMVARRYYFGDRRNPPVLHRKETFVAADYMGREKFERLTRQEERKGLLDDPTIGTLEGWETHLEKHGMRVAGHVLRKA